MQFITGHLNNDEPLELNWQSIADPESTLVIYMGLANLRRITAALIDAGLPADMLAAAVQNGTTETQQRIISTLERLHDAVHKNQLQAPVMIIIGKVVALADELDWFQRELDANFDEGQWHEKKNAAHR